MKIIWSRKAASSFNQIETYILRRFGEKTQQEFRVEVENLVNTLAIMPELGKIDPLFAHRKQLYRSIIVRRLNKIVYYVKDDTLRIAAMWDTRREPKSQAKKVQR